MKLLLIAALGVAVARECKHGQKETEAYDTVNKWCRWGWIEASEKKCNSKESCKKYDWWCAISYDVCRRCVRCVRDDEEDDPPSTRQPSQSPVTQNPTTDSPSGTVSNGPTTAHPTTLQPTNKPTLPPILTFIEVDETLDEVVSCLDRNNLYLGILRAYDSYEFLANAADFFQTNHYRFWADACVENNLLQVGNLSDIFLQNYTNQNNFQDGYCMLQGAYYFLIAEYYPSIGLTNAKLEQAWLNLDNVTMFCPLPFVTQWKPVVVGSSGSGSISYELTTTLETVEESSTTTTVTESLDRQVETYEIIETTNSKEETETVQKFKHHRNLMGWACLHWGHFRWWRTCQDREEGGSVTKNEEITKTTNTEKTSLSFSTTKTITTTASKTITRGVTKKCIVSCDTSNYTGRVGIFLWETKQYLENGDVYVEIQDCIFSCNAFDKPPVCPPDTTFDSKHRICNNGTFMDPQIDTYWSVQALAETPEEDTNDMIEFDAQAAAIDISQAIILQIIIFIIV